MIVDLLLGPYDKSNPQLPSLFPLPKRKKELCFLLFVNLLLSLRSESPTISIVLIQRRLKALRVFQCFTDQSGFGSPNETSLNYFVLLFQCDSQTISLMPPIIIIIIIIIISLIFLNHFFFQLDTSPEATLRFALSDPKEDNGGNESGQIPSFENLTYCCNRGNYQGVVK